MKNFILFLIVLIIPFVVLGADVTNKSVTLVQEDGSAMPTGATPFGYAVYYVDLIHTGAAEDNVTSQAINTSGLELVSVQMLAFGATRDVNISFQGSGVLEDSSFVSSPFSRVGASYGDGDLDDYSPDAGNTDQWLLPQVADTTDAGSTVTKVLRDDPALTARYVRIRSDGQTGNLATTSTKVYFIFKIIDKSRNAWVAYDAQ